MEVTQRSARAEPLSANPPLRRRIPPPLDEPRDGDGEDVMPARRAGERLMRVRQLDDAIAAHLRGDAHELALEKREMDGGTGRIIGGVELACPVAQG